MSKHKYRPGGPRTEQAEDGGDQVHPAGERLQKVLAAAGVGSRRGCEELITAGRIEVDRQVVTELGTRVDPMHQEIRVDGEPLKQPKRLYYAVNKPMGVVTTNFDPSGRDRVIDLVPTDVRVFAVGRLDRSSEGLILVTNDGEFANRVTHPRYGVEKTYLVRVAGSPSEAELSKLRKGVYLSDGFVRAQSVIEKKRHGQSTDLVIVLNEGRNREIRRILARVGHKVLRLKRVAVGPIKLADLPVGNWRRLMPAEIESLLAVAKQKRRAEKRKGTGERGQETGERGHEAAKGALARSASEGIGGSEAPESAYVQQHALMSEPLSLDDLLRDDLDEGNVVESDGTEMSAGKSRPSDEELDGYGFDDGPTGQQGGVIDFEEFEPAEAEETGDRSQGTEDRGAAQRLGAPFSPREKGARGEGAARRGGQQRGDRPNNPYGRPAAGTKSFGKRGTEGRAGGAKEGEEREVLPRESYGRKRGGKRVFSPPNEGRGPAGKTGGNFSFRKKSDVRGERNRTRPEGVPSAGRRPDRARPEGSEQAGERPRKPFGKSAGKKFAKPAGKAGGKKFAKPAGKRFSNTSDGPRPGKRGSARFAKPGSAGGKGGGKSGGAKKGRR